MITLQHLDHVAIRSSHPDTSAEWYRDVLGLELVRVPGWHRYPIMMMCGNQGIAIFPLKGLSENGVENMGRPGFDHLAFRVDKDSFTHAVSRFEERDIPYHIQDHHYFKSVYIHDPDGIKIELTTPVIPLPAI